MSFDDSVWDNENLIKVIKDEGVVVMPTDTIYGMVGKAQSEFVVNKIYKIRKRDPVKPFIILIGSVEELEKFSIILAPEWIKTLEEIWNNKSRPTSIILTCNDPGFTYLHRGKNSLAFRLPNREGLRRLLLKTGPLVAPSANIEKFPESENIQDAKNYFGDSVDLYIDGGSVVSKPSRIIEMHQDGSITVIRE